MPTMRLDRLTVDEVRVEIPTACPSCGLDLLDPEAEAYSGLKVSTYDAHTYYADLVVYQDGTAGYEVADVDTREGGFTVGVACCGCGHLLASTWEAEACWCDACFKERQRAIAEQAGPEG